MADTETPRCALCGRAVKYTQAGIEYCPSCGIENPPTKPLALSEVQAACQDAMHAIATLHTDKQAGWLAYILEGLDEHNGSMADYVLEDLREAISTRLDMGRW